MFELIVNVETEANKLTDDCGEAIVGLLIIIVPVLAPIVNAFELVNKLAVGFADIKLAPIVNANVDVKILAIS